MPPIISKKKCNGCTLCSQICPLDVFGPATPGQVPEVRYPDECWHCRACVIDCPKGAIDLKYPLPLMMLHQVVRDK
jgi:NAD-dependent dihydropyrimidine dehydrogenase PreA subunit